MLIVFYGPSGVGKTSILKHLHRYHAWHVIETVVTRSLRRDEFCKSSVSEETFSAMKNNGEFLFTNVFYSHMYGYPRTKLLHAADDTHRMWGLDYSYANRASVKELSHYVVIVLPGTREQLVARLYAANRGGRIADALEDYDANFAVYNSGHEATPKMLVVRNAEDEIAKTAEQIHLWVKHKSLG
jgi:guanylate kinase